MADGIVSGSVIERTFIGGDLPGVLFAASVPLNDVVVDSSPEGDIDMKRLIAEVLAMPHPWENERPASKPKKGP